MQLDFKPQKINFGLTKIRLKFFGAIETFFHMKHPTSMTIWDKLPNIKSGLSAKKYKTTGAQGDSIFQPRSYGAGLLTMRPPWDLPSYVIFIYPNF